MFQQYIYTLNIDDAIENNCKQYNVLLPNTDIFDKYIEKYQTVFKLHGDVHTYLRNIENETIIFNKKEYIESIKKNGKMLSKLQEDFSDKNIMYIGCSLDDEPDLLSIVTDAVKLRKKECETYFVTLKIPDEEKMDLLEEYGITKIVIIENYMNFYHEFASECKNVKKPIDFLASYCSPQFINIEKKDISIKNVLDSNLITNNPYKNVISIPPFFIERDVLDKIITDLKYISPIQLIYGNRVSGKTYCLIGLLNSIVDKTKYFFPSSTKISDEKLNELFACKNSMFVFDTNCLSDEQILIILKMKKFFSQNNNYVVVTVNSSDKNGVDVITQTNNYCFTKIKNVLSHDEIQRLNKKLQLNNLPTFISKEIKNIRKRKIKIYRTILDNLYMLAEKFPDESLLPNFFGIEEDMTNKILTLLIILATDSEVSSFSLFYFGLREEAMQLTNKCPLHFEFFSSKALPIIDSKNKLTTNSRYFLLKYLGNYATEKKNFPAILNAYQYIYSCISKHENSFNVQRKMLDYVRFDILNDVFHSNNKSAIELIKYLYEGLEDQMNSNPQFKHQRAKSIMWLLSNDLPNMKEAEKYINLARFDVENILKGKANEKLEISLEHIKYTQACICGRICCLMSYSSKEYICKSLHIYYEALSSENNALELEDIRKKKTYKFIYEDLFSLIEKINNDKDNYDDDTITKLNSITRLLSD